MPFTQKLLLIFPPAILAILVVGGGVVLCITGLLIVRRLVPHDKLKVHNDISGPIFGTLGVIYAVLLAFVVIIVWENFDRAALDVDREVNCLVDIYRDAGVFSPEFKLEARGLVREYAESVVNEEWKAVSRGELSPHAERVLAKFWQAYGNYSPQTEAEKAFFRESVRKLNDLSEMRITRLIASRNGIHPLLWFVLVVGGTVTIIFTFFFGAENPKVQIAMAVLLSIVITLILFTILSFDFPFTGGVSISCGPFKELIARIR